MKFFDKMYVGFQRDRYAGADTPRVLGFAVPYGTTQAEKKRMETVDGWSNDEAESRIIDNGPTRGFRLLEVVSRYSTSNKLFRVLDPRGFELEISADNLLELALVSTIVRGEIIEECVWTSAGGIYLIPTSDPRYVAHKSQTTVGKAKIERGEYYVNPGNLLSIFRFEGTFHHTHMELEHAATAGSMLTDPRFNRGYSDRITIAEFNTVAKVLVNAKGNPSYLYTEFRLDDNGNVENITVHARKSHFKGLMPFSGVVPPGAEVHVLDPLRWINKHGYDRNKTIALSQSGYLNFNGFFEDRQSALDYDYEPVAREYMALNSKPSSIDVSKISNRSNSYYYSRDFLPDAKWTLVMDDKRS